jgi:sensor histidine kinase YesM
MKTKGIRPYFVIFILISFSISVLVHFTSILNLFLIDSKKIPGDPYEHHFDDVLLELLITTIVAFSAFVLNYYIIRPFSGYKKSSFKRLIQALVITIFSVFLLSKLLFFIEDIISGIPPDFEELNLLYTFQDIFTGIVVLTGIFVLKVFSERQSAMIDNERLLRENLESQYESLKNQVSPHFLFNSLNALKTLIREDPENARQYLDHLSQVLRHTLQSNQYQTICLADELEVAKSYIFLIKMRFEKNLVANFHITESLNNHRLPPLAIQTLLENAIKHNEISKRNPLRIQISTSESDTIVVTNSLREKITPEPGSGIGLVNLSRQYQHLSGMEIIISKNLNEFRVEIPLLNPLSDDSRNS